MHRFFIILFIPSASQTTNEKSFSSPSCKNFTCKSAARSRRNKIARETKRSADFRSSYRPPRDVSRKRSIRATIPSSSASPLPQRLKNSGWTARSKEEKMRSRIITRSHITDEQRSGPRNAISGFEYKRATDSLEWEDIDHESRWIIDEEDNERYTYPLPFLNFNKLENWIYSEVFVS